ncbi:F-box protein At5g49610 [Dendrobium catenatum]|uniref:F-box protein At5g49610 n=1 Tax=Dendrobium catenatum TaxID=906689 RepID=UPI0009F511FD|nr:F-box protein At5g49610 [Dendrobium catenatum]
MSSADPPSGVLPSDVILLILARLPVKSLFRFKTVCRSWYRLTSEKHFIMLYSLTSLHKPIVLLEVMEPANPIPSFLSVDRFDAASCFSLNFLEDRVKVRASCNGLLCCSSIPNRGVFYVCNPMTKEFRLLPRTRERPFSRFHPDYEETLVGLSFDTCSWKFNVAVAGFCRPFGRRPYEELVCMVFDSETNSWTRFVSSFYDEFTHMNRNQVVFSNNSLHWLTHSCSYVLVLDLRSNVWRKISLPEEIVAVGFCGRIYLLELEGTVSLIQILGVWLYIWALKDYDREHWVLIDRVHLRCILGFAASAFPVCLSSDVVFLATQRKILTYGRKNKVWKEVFSVGDNVAYPLWFSAHPFRSTLFPCDQDVYPRLLCFVTSLNATS